MHQKAQCLSVVNLVSGVRCQNRMRKGFLWLTNLVEDEEEAEEEREMSLGHDPAPTDGQVSD